jgi:hypothetical protein
LNGEGGKIVELARGEKLCVDECAGSIQPDDFTAYQTFGDLGILDLLAQRNDTAGLQ